MGGAEASPFRFESITNKIKAPRQIAERFAWLGDMDSNHDCQDQNLESYH